MLAVALYMYEECPDVLIFTTAPRVAMTRSSSMRGFLRRSCMLTYEDMRSSMPPFKMCKSRRVNGTGHRGVCERGIRPNTFEVEILGSEDELQLKCDALSHSVDKCVFNCLGSRGKEARVRDQNTIDAYSNELD